MDYAEREPIFLLAVTSLVLLLGCFLRLCQLLMIIRKTRLKQFSSVNPASSTVTTKTCSVLSVLGSGGHTKEMIALLQSLPKKTFTPRYYIVARTDKFSVEKIERIQADIGDTDYTLSSIPRSREVKQSYISSIFTTLYSVLYTFPIVAYKRPDIIICNGPGTCIPICFWSILLRFLNITRTKIVYIESICRVKSLSLSGRILYLFADHFIVQWQELKDRFPYSQYIGRLL